MKKIKQFDAKKKYEEYLKSGVGVSEPTYEPNDSEILEHMRIYSPRHTYWCSKTTKESAEAFFRSLDELDENMKSRGTRYAPVSLEDKIVIEKMRIRKNPEYEVEIVYIHDEKQHGYRMFTTSTRYGEFVEVNYDKDNGYFTLKVLDKLREEWRKIHPEDFVQDDVFEDFIMEVN